MFVVLARRPHDTATVPNLGTIHSLVQAPEEIQRPHETESAEMSRRNPIRSCGAVAVDGSRAAFVGATADRIPGRYMVTERHLDDGPVEPVAASPLTMRAGSHGY